MSVQAANGASGKPFIDMGAAALSRSLLDAIEGVQDQVRRGHVDKGTECCLAAGEGAILR